MGEETSGMAAQKNRVLRFGEDGTLRPACHICGKVIETNYTHADWLEKQGLCFECDFWVGEAPPAPLSGWQGALVDPGRVIVAGECYNLGLEDASASAWRGFGGKKFTIRWLDTGKVIESTNLWYRGVIPQRFRADHPDTAEFVTKTK